MLLVLVHALYISGSYLSIFECGIEWDWIWLVGAEVVHSGTDEAIHRLTACCPYITIVS